jgi:hypothetical protein
VSNSPAKAVTTLESETSELIGSGMETLNGKLAGVEEEKLVGRVVELWGFFWDQVLPYVEGVRVLSLYLPSAIVDNLSRCYSLFRPIQFYPPCIVRLRHIEILPQQDKMGKAHPFPHILSHHPTLTSALSPCAPSGTKSYSRLPRC